MNFKTIVPKIQIIVPKIQTHRPENFKTFLKHNSRVPSSRQARRLGFESTAKKRASAKICRSNQQCYSFGATLHGLYNVIECVDTGPEPDSPREGTARPTKPLHLHSSAATRPTSLVLLSKIISYGVLLLLRVVEFERPAKQGLGQAQSDTHRSVNTHPFASV